MNSVVWTVEHMQSWNGWGEAALIVIAGCAAGAMNAVAGGGTILSFPVLMWIGLPPIHANATSAVGLWPGGIGAVAGVRHNLKFKHASVIWLIVAAFVGGLAGAVLLMRTPPRLFQLLAPYLILLSCLLVAAEPHVRKSFGQRFASTHPAVGSVLSFFAILVIATYGGYFGAGLGILLVAALTFAGFERIHESNAWKNLFSVGIKGVAVLYFAFSGAVFWRAALLTGVGSVLGGYCAGVLATRVREQTMRWIIVTMGLFIAAIMLLQLLNSK